MTYTYILSYNVFIKPGEEPVTIDTTAYGSAYSFYVQPEESAKWISYNTTSNIVKYNFNTITASPKAWSYGFSETQLEAVAAENTQL